MPWPLLPPGKTRYPLYRRLDGPQGQSGQVQKILPSPGFNPWTIQPVASSYTDYATRPTEEGGVLHKCIACEVCCLEMKMSEPHESPHIEQCS